MKHYEHRIVEFAHTGAQAANTPWSGTAHELEVDEMGEVVYAEVFSPVAVGGEELLQRWYPILDGDKFDSYLALGGTHSMLMTPPKSCVRGHGIVALGVPFVNAVNQAMPMLANTCPKFKKSINVEAFAGGAITADYTIRLHIYVYRKTELPRIANQMPGINQIHDAQRNRYIPINKGAVAVTYDTWDNLPGGLDQKLPKINPYWRWSANLLATTPNTDYSFRISLGNVAQANGWQEMYWGYEDKEDVLIIKGLGVRPDVAGNLMDACLKIDGDEHPRQRIPTEFDLNNMMANAIPFGQAYPINPDPLANDWLTIPKFDIPYILYDEIGEVVIRDNGAAVAADGVRVALNGTHIELV